MRVPSPLSCHGTVALLLVVALGFLALAVFSPLHQHRPDGSCTLNGFEYVVQAEAQAGVAELELALLAWRETPEQLLSRSLEAPAARLLRGPPSLL